MLPPATPGQAQPSDDALASAAVAPIASGMVVGLGTGRAAARAIRALAARRMREGLEITCVATSLASEALARELGLTVVDLNDAPRPDYLFDGADEVDPRLNLIKGGGAAMTRERIVAQATMAAGGRRVYIVGADKLSTRLGERQRLPVEVLPMALQSLGDSLQSLGLDPQQRVGPDDEPVVTDNGALILDLTIPPERAADDDSLDRVAGLLDCLAGVVDHGLFLDECAELLIEHPAAEGKPARVERRERPQRS